jgi:hypothetical protein
VPKELIYNAAKFALEQQASFDLVNDTDMTVAVKVKIFKENIGTS